MRKHCLQVLEGDAVVLALVLLPMLSLEYTQAGAGGHEDADFEKQLGGV